MQNRSAFLRSHDRTDTEGPKHKETNDRSSSSTRVPSRSAIEASTSSDSAVRRVDSEERGEWERTESETRRERLGRWDAMSERSFRVW